MNGRAFFTARMSFHVRRRSPAPRGRTGATGTVIGWTKRVSGIGRLQVAAEVAQLDVAELLALYDREERLQASESGMRREEAPGVVRLVDTVGRQSAIIFAKLDEAEADSAIERETAYFDGLGHEFEWKLFAHDLPVDMHQRLARHGFEAEEPETILILDLADVPEGLLRPVVADVRRIGSPEGLRDVTAVREAVWPGEHLSLEEHLRHMMRTDPDSLSVYAVYESGRPVSAGRIQFPARSPFAGIWGGATLPASRGKGHYTALLATRVQEAIARGRRFVTIDASPMSRPIVEKYGFRPVTRAQAFIHRPPASG